MKDLLVKYIAYKAWGIFGLTTILSFWGWSKLGVDFTSAYRVFPLLGLIAFGTMWGHYIIWALREWSGANSSKTAKYSKITQWIVLVALVAHPAMINTQLYLDGLGLPIKSYEAYVGKSMMAFIFIGTLSLLAFLAYEFKKWLQKWPKVWKGVVIANHVAMLLVVLHALKLGGSTNQAPLKYLMPLYGLSLIACYIYLGVKKKLF